MKLCCATRFLPLFLLFVLGGQAAEAKEFDFSNARIPENYSPDLKTDEGGLWMQMGELEKNIQLSPFLITDKKLNKYVKGIVCKLTPEHCNQIRVYIIENPHFNASMYPNGMMHVWTGLFLRVENEAQLASVLSHEIGHFVEAHSLERWRKLKSSMAFGSFVNMGLAIAGVAPAGMLVDMAIIAGATSFSRENEREADTYSVHLLARAGYDPNEASVLWGIIEAEKQRALHKHSRTLFNATHPLNSEREEALKEQASTLYGELDSSYKGKKQYQYIVRNHYSKTMDEQIKLHHYGRTEAMLEKHAASEMDEGLVYFYKAKHHASRGDEGDIAEALENYLFAQQYESTPSEAYRDAGYLYLKQKDMQNARMQFIRYLMKKPDADDKEMIDYYIDSIKE